MRGRGKFEATRIILAAHTGEAFARRKLLKPAEHYLKQAERGRDKPPPSAVAAMAGRMQKAGLAVTVRRLSAKERSAYNGRSNARLS